MEPRQAQVARRGRAREHDGRVVLGFAEEERGVFAPHVEADAGGPHEQEIQIRLVVLIHVVVPHRGRGRRLGGEAVLAGDGRDDLGVRHVDELARPGRARQAMEPVGRQDHHVVPRGVEYLDAYGLARHNGIRRRIGSPGLHLHVVTDLHDTGELLAFPPAHGDPCRRGLIDLLLDDDLVPDAFRKRDPSDRGPQAVPLLAGQTEGARKGDDTGDEIQGPIPAHGGGSPVRRGETSGRVAQSGGQFQPSVIPCRLGGGTCRRLRPRTAVTSG